jgi:hypothetical protein
LHTSRHLIILLYCSLVIFDGAFATNLKEAKGMLEVGATGEQV